MTAAISIVIADDHPIVRQGLRQALAADAGLQVLAEAGDGEEALAAIRQHRPRIALLDMDMPKLGGMEVARAIIKEKLPVEVVYLTIHSEEDLFHAAMDIGAKGYILKESASMEIVTALRTVSDGHYYVTPSLTGYLVRRNSRASTLANDVPTLNDLSPTERRILRMIAHDKSSKDIAKELFLHYRTVENHRTNICQKLQLHGHNALYRFAQKHRLTL
jgi:DNA-binding NarL/FixJ family response regulator